MRLSVSLSFSCGSATGSAVGERVDAGLALKERRKMFLVAEGGALCDFGNGQIGLDEQAAGFVESQPEVILTQCAAGFSAERGA
jgi:hypothetical protein